MGPPDVVVESAGVRSNGVHSKPTRRIVEPTGGWLEVFESATTRLRFGYADHHVDFDVAAGGERVVVTRSPAVLPVHVATLLFTTVLTYLLHLHGRLALHASVVAWEGAGFVLAGVQGAGKSTTVGALAQCGALPVADDAAALSLGPTGWTVHPGLCGVRLAPDARAALGVPATAVTPVWARSPALVGVDYGRIEDKVIMPAGNGGDPAALPLAGVFLLPDRSPAIAAPRLTAVPAAAAVPQLAGHLLRPAWQENAVVDRMRFLALGGLARRTPVRMVERPDSLDELPRLCDGLIGEMESMRLCR